MTSLVFRRATSDDAKRLFQWRNDPDTRRNSHSTEEIEFEAHCAWLQNVLDKPEWTILIAEIENTPVGTIRSVQQSDGSSILSWIVAPEVRGRGLARQMISYVSDLLVDVPLSAEIKSSNTASIKAAEAAGFRCEHESHGVLLYRR